MSRGPIQLGAGVALALTLACAGVSTPGRPAVQRSWLASTGFPARADWPSATLHMSRQEIGVVRLVTDLLDRDSTLLVRRPEGEGWGIHRRLPGDEPGCALTVLVNGVELVRLREERMITLDGVVRGRELDGLEVHQGDGGPTMGSVRCGAVLMWSERIAEPADEPFAGRIVGAVVGEAADTVTEVQLDPDGRSERPDAQGRFEFDGVLPGVYDVVYLSASGPMGRRPARVYAYHDSELEWFEINRRWPGRPR
jgi:hypothetical protein